MKRVPSGSEDFCIKGAREVSGTIIVGIPAPATDGAEPVIEKNEAVPEEVSEGAEVTVKEEASVVDAEVGPVVVAAEDEAVEEGVAAEFSDEPLEPDEVPGRVAVERFGRSV